MSLLLLFQGDGSAPVIVAPVLDLSDGKPRKSKRFRSADDELTEDEYKFMERKLIELRRAKNERERNAAAKALEVAVAQADVELPAPEPVVKAKPFVGDPSLKRDAALLASIANELSKIAMQAAANVRRRNDDDEIELISLII